MVRGWKNASGYFFLMHNSCRELIWLEIMKDTHTIHTHTHIVHTYSTDRTMCCRPDTGGQSLLSRLAGYHWRM